MRKNKKGIKNGILYATISLSVFLVSTAFAQVPATTETLSDIDATLTEKETKVKDAFTRDILETQIKETLNEVESTTDEIKRDVSSLREESEVEGIVGSDKAETVETNTPPITNTKEVREERAIREQKVRDGTVEVQRKVKKGLERIREDIQKLREHRKYLQEKDIVDKEAIDTVENYLKNEKQRNNDDREALKTKVEDAFRVKTEIEKETVRARLPQKSIDAAGVDGKTKDDIGEGADTTDMGVEQLFSEMSGYVENELSDIEQETARTSKEVKQLEQKRLKKMEKIISRALERRAKKDALKDSDGDGVSDYDEIHIFETDPNNPDSDSDGYVDGAEVLAGFNPKNPAEDAVVIYENPKNAGRVEEGLFAVSKIDVVAGEDAVSDTAAGTRTGDIAPKAGTVATTIPAKEKASDTSAARIVLEGKSLPNTFLTLYIFSIPTVVTVKTDKDGNWKYVMDRELEDGEHEVYVAMTDNAGKIIAKSDPIPFVKRAHAVTVNEELLSTQIDGVQPTFFNLGYFYIAVLATILVVGTILTIIGARIQLREHRYFTKQE